MERLPREQYEVLALAYFAGLSQSEIAAQLAVPLRTVKAHTFAACAGCPRCGGGQSRLTRDLRP